MGGNVGGVRRRGGHGSNFKVGDGFGGVIERESSRWGGVHLLYGLHRLGGAVQKLGGGVKLAEEISAGDVSAAV